MKKITFLALLFLPLHSDSSEVYIFDNPQSVPDNCIHYVKPNRYVCRDADAFVEFHNVAYVDEIFSAYKNTSKDGIFFEAREIDGYTHMFAKEETDDGEYKQYSICDKQQCIVVAAQSNTAIQQWLQPLSSVLLIDGR
ncbi:hypothetical protein LJ739_11430 [Aestuariibacter halophilus]|uniref:Uncharacterized protein n=1 Tax=Fluctibacter halophilus TaxID=226011 RepID=A0ABS8GAW2_9ALTE|nr:hypothetical protein [Aestuariibacter halophilus]MCC2616854.1 hypothetical protein [Aestuariibacter halophilus]